MAEPVALDVLGQASLAACGSDRWPEVWRVGGWILRDGRAHGRSRVHAGAELKSVKFGHEKFVTGLTQLNQNATDIFPFPFAVDNITVQAGTFEIKSNGNIQIHALPAGHRVGQWRDAISI